MNLTQIFSCTVKFITSTYSVEECYLSSFVGFNFTCYYMVSDKFGYKSENLKIKHLLYVDLCLVWHLINYCEKFKPVETLTYFTVKMLSAKFLKI